MSKILFLGHEGSGKTVLMGILSRYFETAGDGKWCLNPKNEAAFSFMENVPAILAAGKWPAQTTLDSIRLFEWDLEYAGNVYTKLEMVDYPGEAFRALFDQSKVNDILNGHRPDCIILSDLIRAAENIFLIINPRDILQKEKNPNRTKTIWQLCEAVDYLKTLPKKPKLTLVLTQMDRYCDSVETLNAKQTLLSENTLFVKRGFATLDIIGVSAVGKTVKNRYGDDVPNMKNSHPINLSNLALRILENSIVTIDIRNLNEVIVSTKQELNRHCSTLDQCTNLIRNLKNIILKIQPTCVKYGYLLGEKLYRECSSLIAQCERTIIHLKQQEKELSIQAELERKQKETEDILSKLKNDINDATTLLTSVSKTLPQTSSQCEEKISKLETLKSLIQTTYINHNALIGELLIKQSINILKKCDPTILKLESHLQKLLTKEARLREQKKEEKRRKLQIEIKQATEQLNLQVNVINTKESFTYETLCKHLSSIRSDCQFIIQHDSSITIAHDLGKINNLLCQYKANPAKADFLLLQFEAKYPFVTKAKLAIDKKRQCEIRKKRLDASNRLLCTLYICLRIATICLSIATIPCVVVDLPVFIAYLTTPSIVQWDSVFSFNIFLFTLTFIVAVLVRCGFRR